MPERHAFHRLLLGAALAASVLASATGGADDTDLYVDNDRDPPPSSRPLVMLSLDYRANLTRAADAASERYFRDLGLGADVDQLKALGGGQWTFFDVLILSLKTVLREVRGVKIGLMFNHNEAGAAAGYDSGPGGSNGGVILMGFHDIDSAGTRAAFLDELIALKTLKPDSSSPDHPYQGSELFFEFFRYLTGQGIYNGHNGVFDFESGGGKDADTNMRCSDPAAASDLACWDPTIESGTRYVSPLAGSDACARIFTVNFMFQVSQQENDPSLFTSAQADGGLGIAAPATQNGYFPAVLGFLHGNDLATGALGTAPDLAGKQNVTSFFVVDPRFINATTQAYTASGGTGAPLPLADDPAALVATLRSIFQQILGVSTTLVAASVPVNVFNRSEIVDNVYFALFQAQGAPTGSNVAPGGPAFWPGNLKKLRLESRDVADADGNAGKRLAIVDARGEPAIGADGRIALDAQSLWTDPRDALLDAGDVNGDGRVDATDGGDADTAADNILPPAATGAGWVAANPPDLTPDRDGRYIPRGGAGQRIPGFTTGSPGDSSPDSGVAADAGGPRKVFYLTRSAGTAALTSLDAADAGAAELKADFGDATMSDADARTLIRYARGQDVNDEDGDGDRSEPRFWLLGDPLHSRPLPLNYGAAQGHGDRANPAIFIAMAANDGALHMFRNTAPGAPSDAPISGTGAPGQLGQEVWAFFPPEGLAVQKQLMSNDPTHVPLHPYSFDGEPAALVLDQDADGTIEAGDRVILYVGLRRGGAGTSSATIASAYYAIDVTDPLEPVFLWRITPTSRTTPSGEQATADFAEMGYTFSRPRVGTVQDGASRRLAVFFGGGYDGGYTGALDGDGRPVRFGNDVDGAMADDQRGRALYVVRANDAALLWKAVAGGTTSRETRTATRTFVHAGLRDSIPSNLTIVDTDADGAIDRILAGDTGGNVWRADLGGDADNDGTNVDNWKLARLACFGRHGGPDCGEITARLHDRRFFHEPDLVQTRDENGVRYDAVVIGSGDREDPLDQGGDVDNYLYVIRDYNVGVGAGTDTARRHAQMTDITATCLPDTPCAIAAPGWRLFLGHGPDGEKALSAPLTLANTVFFTTYLPPPANGAGGAATCGPREGSGFLYALSLTDGAPRYNYDTSTGGQTRDPGTRAEDRSIALETQGIPAQVVHLGSPGGAGPGAGGCTVNVLAGARVFEAPGCPRFRTFWQRVGP